MKLIGEQDYIIFHHTMCIQSSTSCEIFDRIHIKMIKYHTVSPLTNFHSFKGTIGCLLFPTRSLGKRRGFAENPKGFQGTEGITHCITIWHRPLLVNRGGLELWLWRDDFLRHWLIFSVAFSDLLWSLHQRWSLDRLCIHFSKMSSSFGALKHFLTYILRE